MTHLFVTRSCELCMGPRKDRIVKPGIIWSCKESFIGILRCSADANGWIVHGDCNDTEVLLLILSKRCQGNLDYISKVSTLVQSRASFFRGCVGAKVGSDHPLNVKVEAHPNCMRGMMERHTFQIVYWHLCGGMRPRDIDRYILLQPKSCDLARLM